MLSWKVAVTANYCGIVAVGCVSDLVNPAQYDVELKKYNGQAKEADNYEEFEELPLEVLHPTPAKKRTTLAEEVCQEWER